MYLDEDDAQLLDEQEDEVILARSVSDPVAFGVLIDRYQAAFLRKVMSILHDRIASEDVVQEAFAKIYLNADRFEKQEGASFKSWAYKIVVNTALTQYSKRKRDRSRTADLEPEFYEMLPDRKSLQFEKQELRDYVVSVLARMPEQLSRVLELHFLKGQSQQEIADLEGSTVGAIKTRVHRAKQSFREAAKKISLPIE